MNVWFTADCHFNHKNIIFYCNRPYETAKEMNKALIDNWNSVVEPEDTVVVVGDMFMGSWKNISEIVPQLNGDIRLVVGNHDDQRRQEEMKKAGVIIEEYQITYYDDEGGPILVAGHDPECFADLTYIDYVNDLNEHGVFVDGRDIILIYGHVHDAAPAGIQKEDTGVYSFHVGVDTNNYTPVSWDYIIEQYNHFKEKEDAKA